MVSVIQWCNPLTHHQIYEPYQLILRKYLQYDKHNLYRMEMLCLKLDQHPQDYQDRGIP